MDGGICEKQECDGCALSFRHFPCSLYTAQAEFRNLDEQFVLFVFDRGGVGVRVMVLYVHLKPL